jgi:hypothetical protein
MPRKSSIQLFEVVFSLVIPAKAGIALAICCQTILSDTREAPERLAGFAVPKHFRLRGNDELNQLLWLSQYGINARKRARLTAICNWRW